MGSGRGGGGGSPGTDSRWAIRFAHSPALRLLWSPQLLGSDSAAGRKPAMAKVTFHAKMGSIKDRNGMDLTEAEDIKRWQEYRWVLYC